MIHSRIGFKIKCANVSRTGFRWNRVWVKSEKIIVLLLIISSTSGTTILAQEIEIVNENGPIDWIPVLVLDSVRMNPEKGIEILSRHLFDWGLFNHEQYLEAGADIVETNTFSGTTIAQADYELESVVYELNYEAARIAREACDKFTNLNPDKPRFVAGAIGPTNKTASISPDVNRPEYRAITFDQLSEAYKEQARGLMDGGSDVLLIETIFDTLNAKAALFGVIELFDETGKELPIMISGTITDASGRTLSGQTLEAFLISLSHVPLLSIGLNCSFGAKDLKPYLQRIAKESPFYISAYPNAGLPNEFGEYDQDAETMGKEVRAYLDEHLINIIGGCCGTGPDHIRRMTEIVKDYQPRFINEVVIF